jgi:hypothetical protein
MRLSTVSQYCPHKRTAVLRTIREADPKFCGDNDLGWKYERDADGTAPAMSRIA